jgi:hypothetical protein
MQRVVDRHLGERAQKRWHTGRLVANATVGMFLCTSLAVCTGQCDPYPDFTVFVYFAGQTKLLTCAEAHVVTVRFTFDEETQTGEPYHPRKEFPCRGDLNYSFQLPEGYYSARVEGLNAAGVPCFTVWHTHVPHILPEGGIAMGKSYYWTLPSTDKCKESPSDAGSPDGKRDSIGKPDAPRPDAPRPDAPAPDAPKLDTAKSDATAGCVAPSAGMQTFGGGMYGCAEAVSWAARATLCAAGYHVCSGAEWVANRGTATPSFSYWTDANLNYGGGVAGGCYASLTNGTPCTTGGPMHVCAGATDPKGNTCTFFGCGYLVASPNQFFGGCNAPTAGTLCCK